MSQIISIVKKVANGESSARAEVEAAIERAKAIKEFNAILSLGEEYALAQADIIDDRIKQGLKVGILAGVPFIAKDNFLTYGTTTTAASKILENFKSPLQATSIEKLEAAGAICIGKANLDAFAHGGSTENSAFGPTLNSADQTRVAGGSSGGSAVVAALGVVPFALGTDTGGSVREPASFNGVYGIKPTYGMVSRYGVVAMSSTTDTVGCFTTTAADAELVYQAMSGRDPRDMTTLPDFFNPVSVKPAQKIGLIKEFMGEGIDDDVRARTLEYADKLRAAGHTVEEVELPMAKHTLAMYYIIVSAEVSSNLARYDGIRYGLRSEKAKSLGNVYGMSRDEGFMPENKRRIILGSYVLSSGYFDAYYMKAQKARTLLIREFNALFEDYDALLGPVSPTPAFKLGANTSDPVKMYMADILTVPANLAGIPAISVPVGNDSEGLPVGVQLIGNQRSDASLLALAKSLEESA